MMVETTRSAALAVQTPEIPNERLEQILSDVRADIRRERAEREAFFALQYQVGFGMRQALAA